MGFEPIWISCVTGRQPHQSSSIIQEYVFCSEKTQNRASGATCSLMPNCLDSTMLPKPNSICLSRCITCWLSRGFKNDSRAVLTVCNASLFLLVDKADSNQLPLRKPFGFTSQINLSLLPAAFSATVLSNLHHYHFTNNQFSNTVCKQYPTNIMNARVFQHCSAYWL